MRSFGMTKIPSLVVSTSSIFVSVSNPAVTSLHRHNRLSSTALDSDHVSVSCINVLIRRLLVWVSKAIIQSTLREVCAMGSLWLVGQDHSLARGGHEGAPKYGVLLIQVWRWPQQDREG